MEAFEDKLNSLLTIEEEWIAIKFFYYVPQLSGVVSYFRGNWLYVSIIQYVLFVSLCTFSLFQVIYTTYLIKDILSVAVITFHIAGIQLFCLSTLLLNLKRPIIVDNWLTMLYNFYDYGPSFDTSETKNWMKDYEKSKDRILLFYIFLFAMCAVQLIIIGPIMDNMQDFSFNSTFINGVFMDSPYPVWFPFQTDIYFTFIYEMVAFGVVLLILFCGVFMILCVSHSITYQIRRLRHSIASLEKRALFLCKEDYPEFPDYETRMELYSDHRFVEKYEYCIHQNIEHHKNILRIRRNLDELQRWPMFNVVLFMSFNIACTLFIIFKGEKRLSPIFFSLSLFITELCTLTFLCQRGQELIDESDKLYRAFYMTTQWFYCPSSVKKLMLVINEYNKKQLSYKAGGFTDINWELYGSILNSAYTYLNLLKAMMEKQNENS